MTAVATRSESVLPADIMATYMEMLNAIPSFEGDGGASMVAGILNAEKWEDLQDDASSLPNAKAMVGKELRIDHDGILSMESDQAFDDGTGIYLIIRSVDLDSGEVVVWQTSAMTVKAKLVKLFKLGGSYVIQLSEAKKATKAGFYPINCNVLSKSK